MIFEKCTVMELRLLTNREDVVMIDIVTDKEINIDLLFIIKKPKFHWQYKYLRRQTNTILRGMKYPAILKLEPSWGQTFGEVY